MRSVCNCHPFAGPVGCSWWRFIGTLLPDDPVRADTETGAEHLAWRDGRWNREPCRCDCHDGDNP